MTSPTGTGATETAPGGLAGAVPFRTFIVKLHTRCNLACTYCYIYTGPDVTWRQRARATTRRVLDQTAARIAEHVARHGIADINIVLHGGEPLLAGIDLVTYAADTIRAAVPAGTQVDVRVQTNGTLLTEEVLQRLLTHDVKVGVSVDGDRASHDRHRRGPDGRGSYDAVARAVALLNCPRFRPIFAGILSTVDLANDPVATFRSLAAMAPPRLDFLLPHANWSLPPGSCPPASHGGWLVDVFDDWFDTVPVRVHVRLFEEIIRLALGATGRTEILGLAPVDIVVVETDGALEQVDTLRSTFHGATWTGLDVFQHSFDQALGHPDVMARQGGVASLCSTCRGCGLRNICGGGYYPHRYRQGTGFDNPSVYCEDLKLLIGHVITRVHRDLTRLTNGAGSQARAGPT